MPRFKSNRNQKWNNHLRRGGIIFPMSKIHLSKWKNVYRKRKKGKHHFIHGLLKLHFSSFLAGEKTLSLLVSQRKSSACCFDIWVKQRKASLNFTYKRFQLHPVLIFPLFMLTPWRFVFICVEKYFNFFSVCASTTKRKTNLHNGTCEWIMYTVEKAVQYDNRYSYSYDGMKGPICSLIYTFPIHIFFEITQRRKNEESGKTLDYWLTKSSFRKLWSAIWCDLKI